MVSPTKCRSSLGLLAMHKPPIRYSIKSADSTKKKLSFATFEQYSACKGYRYPTMQNCIDTITDVVMISLLMNVSTSGSLPPGLELDGGSTTYRFWYGCPIAGVASVDHVTDT